MNVELILCSFAAGLVVHVIVALLTVRFLGWTTVQATFRFSVPGIVGAVAALVLLSPNALARCAHEALAGFAAGGVVTLVASLFALTDRKNDDG